MRSDLLGFAASTSVVLLALGCGRDSLGLGAGGGSGGTSGGVGGSGGLESQYGGVSGSGDRQAGGTTGPGQGAGGCPAHSCPAVECPKGSVVVSIECADCRNTCDCPCPCWACDFGTGGIVSSGGASGSAGTGGAISSGGTSGPSGSGGVVSSGGVTGKYTGQTPVNHRPSGAQCSSERGPGPQVCDGVTCTTSQPYPSPYASTCSSDSQCTHGVNGRCFPWEGLITAGGCSYDECSTDSDCGTRTPCICRSSSTDNSANICDVGGNCAVDSDCGPGGYCSPSIEACYSANPNVEAEGKFLPGNIPSPYYCHTASDICINDSDCAPVDAGTVTLPLRYSPCAYNVQNSRWECTQLTCGLP